MSGGSYSYAYRAVEDFSNNLLCNDSNFSSDSVELRKRFADHLKLVANAMHDIEWVDSYDYSEGDENAAIRLVLGEKNE